MEMFVDQDFQVPKMEVYTEPYFRLFWEWIFPYISLIHTAYRGEYLYFRYLTFFDDLYQLSMWIEVGADKSCYQK